MRFLPLSCCAGVVCLTASLCGSAQTASPVSDPVSNPGSFPASAAARPTGTTGTSAGTALSPLQTAAARSSPAAAGIALRTTVEVHADVGRLSPEQDAPLPLHATASEILASAGTHGDLSRYLQVLPGVVFNNDYSDDVIVRGGNPMENLYLVDGIEIPNINHIASEGTTGGLVSMIDTAATQGIDFYTGAYDASYDERLSSVVAIHTLPGGDGETHVESDLGFIGLGGLAVLPLGEKSSLLASVHRSLLNLVTSDIGLGGTPVYSNILLRAQLNPDSANALTLLSLSGFDSINIVPGGWKGVGTGADCDETSTINMQYGGWRTTNGLLWHHTFSNRFFGVLGASDSEQDENIQQQNQFYEVQNTTSFVAETGTPTAVYSQLSHDGRATLKYDLVFDSGRRWSVVAGTSANLNHVNYQIAQPLGEQSSLSVNPANSDADSFSPNFLSGETGSYAELTLRPAARWSISGGGRLQTFALGGHATATPRVYSSFRPSSHTALHAAYGEYAQMPPSIYVTSWPQNYSLLPIRARHVVAGVEVGAGPSIRLGLEGYLKNYRDYPVSTEYPSLSLANIVDELGQQFLWIPLASRGTGFARGVEATAAAHLGTHVSGQTNVAWARTEFAGLDGIARPGNFDYPIVGNATGTWHTKSWEASWRYSYTTGHPYTPFLLGASAQQNRPIYDLSRVNGLRASVYSRFDFETDRTVRVAGGQLILYGGLDNAWDRRNFLGYYWMPRIDAYGWCSSNPSQCVSEQYDMVRFPDFGVRYIF